jgi:hypothetical protein
MLEDKDVATAIMINYTPLKVTMPMRALHALHHVNSLADQ